MTDNPDITRSARYLYRGHPIVEELCDRLDWLRTIIENRWQQLEAGGCDRAVFDLMGEPHGPTYGEFTDALDGITHPPLPPIEHDPVATRLGLTGGHHVPPTS